MAEKKVLDVWSNCMKSAGMKRNYDRDLGIVSFPWLTKMARFQCEVRADDTKGTVNFIVALEEFCAEKLRPVMDRMCNEANTRMIFGFMSMVSSTGEVRYRSSVDTERTVTIDYIKEFVDLSTKSLSKVYPAISSVMRGESWESGVSMIDKAAKSE